MEIINYNKSLHNKIIDFNKQAFPLRKGVEASFDRRFYANIAGNYIEKTYYVVDEKTQEVFGQFLIMANHFYYQQKKYEGGWGFDFIIDEKLRGQKKGKILAEKVMKTPNYCVLGVSKASEHLHYKLGNKKVGEAFRYIRFLNLLSPTRLIFKKSDFDKYKVSYPETIKANKMSFKRITYVHQLPDKPYWNENKLEWDRSAEFLKWRFFEKENKYAFYISEGKNEYFVVRKVRWRNLNVLLLVDYRYNGGKVFENMYKMVLKIAKKTDCSAVISLSSNQEEQAFLKRKMNIKFGDSLLVMTTCKEVGNVKEASVTFADSDADNFYGDNIW
ncbi:MAG: hypothetical protein CSA38_02075 [Flavobacteriales bacterium]|nr:MAG: hypothetical protein CSA38_02075 [Flavobacteriales bacterium]